MTLLRKLLYYSDDCRYVRLGRDSRRGSLRGRQARQARVHRRNGCRQSHRQNEARRRHEVGPLFDIIMNKALSIQPMFFYYKIIV